MYLQIPKHSIVVQKYGGTSVGSVERILNLAERTKRLKDKFDLKLAIVVSAMSGETNKLVDLMNRVNPNASGHAYDMALAAGEQVAVALVAAALEKYGIKSRGFLAYQLGIHTDIYHSRARILNIQTEAIENLWKENGVAVVAGFQGMNHEMEITTLGRGGSDTSAVALAVALKAKFCEINTDVNGVYSADPRYISEAKLIPKMDYEVALEMASLGSKVLHSRCVELGAKFSMPITVRNSFKDDDSERTVIMNFSEKEALESPVISGVSLDHAVARISILIKNKVPKNILGQIFSVLAESGINIDIIITNDGMNEGDFKLGFTLPQNDLDKGEKILHHFFNKNFKTDFSFEIKKEDKLAKVSCVGVGMRSHSGVAAKVFKTLEEVEIPIHMISTSEIKISCVVSQKHGEKACNVLHAAFI